MNILFVLIIIGKVRSNIRGIQVESPKNFFKNSTCYEYIRTIIQQVYINNIVLNEVQSRFYNRVYNPVEFSPLGTLQIKHAISENGWEMHSGN